MATDFVFTGSISFGASVAIESIDPNDLLVITEFATDTSENKPLLTFSGEVSINSIFPTQLVLGGHWGLSGVSALASASPPEPAITELVVGGYMGLSSELTLETASPISHTTALATAGNMILGGVCAIGDVKDLATNKTDFVTIGGLGLGGSVRIASIDAVVAVTTALATTGGFAFGATVALDSPARSITALSCVLSYLVGGQPSFGNVRPSVTAFVTSGGFILSSPMGDESVFEAWAFNGQAFEPSMFSGFRFNSFAHRGVQTYAAGEEGIFLLGGDNDDGEVFHTGARIGPVNFGADRDKRMRGIQLGNCGADTKVRVATEDKEGVFALNRDTNRVVVSRDIQGREFTIDFMDFQELSQFEATVLMLARR